MTSTTPAGRDWLEMTPAHFDSSLLPRKYRKPDPAALFTVADLVPGSPETAKTPVPQLEGQGDLFGLADL